MNNDLSQQRSRPLAVYRFRIDDPDPEVLVFGCVANSEAEAEILARMAGHNQFTMMDFTPLEPEQTQEAARQRILDNPMLGRQWLALADAISVMTANLRTGRFWSMSTYLPQYQWDPYMSPFVQAMLEADGSLHVEIGGVLTADLLPHREQALSILGWVDSGSTSKDPDEHRQLPLPYKTFEPGWNSTVVAEMIFIALAFGYGVTNTVAFNVGGAMTKAQISQIRGLRFLDKGHIFTFRPPDEY